MSVAACGGITDGIANQVLDDEGVSINGESVTIENADGTTTTAGTGLPADWPTAFPLPEGHQVQGGVSEAGQYDIIASIVVPGSVADNTAAFADDLPGAGFTIRSNVSGPDRTTTMFEITGHGVVGQVVLNPQGEDSLLGVTLEESSR